MRNNRRKLPAATSTAHGLLGGHALCLLGARVDTDDLVVWSHAESRGLPSTAPMMRARKDNGRAGAAGRQALPTSSTDCTHVGSPTAEPGRPALAWVTTVANDQKEV